MRFKEIIIASLFLVTGVSCSDFLERTPNTGINQGEALRNMADMEKLLVSIYSPFKTSALFSGSATLLPDMQADFMYSIVGYSNNMGLFYQWDFNAQDGDVSSVWEVANQVIARSNFLLNGKEGIELKTATDSLRFHAILGETHFARALAYSELVKLYCDPYGKNLGGTDADPKKQLGLPIVKTFGIVIPARANLYDTYELILSELSQAFGRISTTKREDVYFSKAAVKALEARIHLYMRNWGKAVTAATYVIDSCDYKLTDATVENSPYESMFMTDMGSEVIWKVSFSKTDLGGALGAPFYNNSNGNFSPDYVPAQWVLDLYQDDARYDVFFKEQKTVLGGNLTWPMLKKYPGNPALWTGTNSNFTNMPKVFRLAEQYLIRAEAYLESGDETNALNDLRELQAKRLKRVRTINNVRQEIRDERVRELYMEGYRLFDLKRWGLGFKRMPQKGTISPSNALKIEKDNVFFTWPIPSHELDVPNSQMQGNPSNRK